MSSKQDPYVSEEETNALLVSDPRSATEKLIDQLIESKSSPEACGADREIAIHMVLVDILELKTPRPLHYAHHSIGAGLPMHSVFGWIALIAKLEDQLGINPVHSTGQSKKSCGSKCDGMGYCTHLKTNMTNPEGKTIHGDA